VIEIDGNPVGRANSNPLLDSRNYLVEYVDGSNEELTANVIAENILSQIDDEGRQQMMLSEIIDHRVLSDAIPQSKRTYENAYGVKRRKVTKRVWQILVEWKDWSTDWVELKDLKESFPVELAMYAKSHKIADKPAFAWWVPFVLKKQKCILQGENQILVPYTQIWHSYPKEHQRGHGDRLRSREHPMDGCNPYGNEECSSRF
jgi:hypothetical protein